MREDGEIYVPTSACIDFGSKLNTISIKFASVL